MKKLLGTLAAALVCFIATAATADTYVEGYFRKDGAYVAPHYRSSPDRSYNNNWSVSPNVNPYTGKRGTRAPTWNDRPPSTNYGGGSGYRKPRFPGSTYKP